MKKFGILFASALALLAFAACSDDEDEINKEESYDDSYYAAQATVTSSDANFTASSNGGTINFKTEGGTVTLDVSCGCDWIADNEAADLFTTSVTSTTLTVTAEQNTVEEELTGTVIVKTSNEGIVFATITVTQSAYGAPEISVETNEWNAPAKGALTAEISVEATADWTAESADAWLTVVKTDTGISLTADENGETTERSTKVTLACTDGIRTEYEYIAVSQDGLSYITLSDENVSFGSEEGSATVTVESNFDWDYSYDTSNDWLNVTRNGDVLTVTASANDSGDDREETITFTAGDGAENATEAQLTIIQAASTENNMIFTYTITSANTTTQLPLSGTVDCTVDWGDGTVETITSAQPSHTYVEAGEYDIIVCGTVSQLYAHDISTNTNPLPIIAVKQWGNTGLTSLNDAFWYCKNLKSLPEYTGNALDNVTDFYCAFYYCTVLEEIPAGLFNGCSFAKDFRWVFGTCETIKTLPQGLFDNCASATTFYCAFQYCSALETIPDGLFDNCPEVTSFDGLFESCSSLKEIPAGLFDNCTKVTDFSYCFYNCSSLEKIPSQLFNNCPEVTTFTYTFRNCSSLEKIPSQLFGNCPKVTTLSECFRNCSSLKTIEADAFSAYMSATNMSYIFAGCSSLEKIPEGLFDNCTDVTSFESAFYNDKSLETIPGCLFANCLKVKSYKNTFDTCTSLTVVPAELFANCPEATDFYGAFYECSSLKTIPADMFTNCPKATSFECTFYKCTSLTGIPSGLFDGCPEATSFYMTFYTTAVSSIPMGLFDKNTKAQDFNAIFYDCTNITEIPTGLFDNCPNATDFSFAFRGCTGITSIPENLFAKNSEVTTFQSTFCLGSYTEIPPAIFSNNRKVTNFNYTFGECYNVTGESPYDEIDGVKVHLYERADHPDIYTTPTTISNCFYGCKGLTDYNNIPSSWGGGGASTNSISSDSISVNERHSVESTSATEFRTFYPL